MKKYAFTLAEVLVVLGIIGVIATLTLPTVMDGYKKKTWIAQLRDVHNKVSTAAQAYMFENRVNNLAESDLVNTNGVQDFMKNYFKITNDCGNNPGDCFGDYYRLDSGETADAMGGESCVMLNTGASICLQMMSSNLSCTGEGDEKTCLPTYDRKNISEHGYANLTIDINGPQGPNLAGRDYFTTKLYSDGKVADSYSKSDRGCQRHIDSSVYADGCLDNIMRDGWKMDY